MNNFHLSDWIQALFKKFVQFIKMNLQDMTKPSGTDQSIPYIISPRRGFLDTRRPKLRWNPVQGATSYTVKIAKIGKNPEIVWETKVKEAEFNSSEDLPLEVGVDYSLIVKSDNGRSSEMDSDISKTSFQLLEQDKIKSLADEEKKITDLGLEDDEETLELAYFHFSKSGCIDKAMEILEQKIAAQSQTSEIYVMYAQIHRVIGLYVLAEKLYQEVLKSIKPGEELEEQIIAKAGLVEIYTIWGKEEKANRLRQERKTHLETLSINRESRSISQQSTILAIRQKRKSCNCPSGLKSKNSDGLCVIDCIP